MSWVKRSGPLLSGLAHSSSATNNSMIRLDRPAMLLSIGSFVGNACVCGEESGGRATHGVEWEETMPSC